MMNCRTFVSSISRAILAGLSIWACEPPSAHSEELKQVEVDRSGVPTGGGDSSPAQSYATSPDFNRLMEGREARSPAIMRVSDPGSKHPRSIPGNVLRGPP